MGQSVRIACLCVCDTLIVNHEKTFSRYGKGRPGSFLSMSADVAVWVNDSMLHGGGVDHKFISHKRNSTE